MAHSRGPWTVRKNFGNHWGMREVIGPALSVVGFTSATDIDDETRGRIEADASLIAAAPELLAVLKLLHTEAMCMCKQLAARGLPGVPGDIVDVVTEAARAAIERATGTGSSSG